MNKKEKEVNKKEIKKTEAHLAALKMGQSFLKEFMDFLNEYKIIGLAVAFVMGAAATDLVKSVVNDLVMPLITPFIAGGAWKTAVLTLGPIVIKWGSLLGAIINFLVIALVVFITAKWILKEQKVTKK